MIILVVSSQYAAYDLKCPDRPHRNIRANWLCNSKVEDYSCLLDLQNGSFKESCSFTSDFVRPGQKYVFSGRRKNTNCSNGRYQPFKFYSAELSMCALVKSICREEGQISFNDGSTKEDRHCSCDYTRGYTFLSRQNHQCFCNPGEADCSCYIANCSTIGQLSTDYECKSAPISTAICQPIVYTRPREDVNKFFVKKGMAQRYKRQDIRSLGSVRAIAIITVLLIIVDILIVIDFMNMSIVLRHKWNDFNCKQTDVDEDQSLADGGYSLMSNSLFHRIVYKRPILFFSQKFRLK
ncbi:unnamed protein product [Mytilus edulis]|uniref:Uncharacterized protein n=1 Tax=Mytilus edulis TaxID=6550 RepID=A0A8S3U8R2_MYTED|nr:unnamed protein product [Mytilus edulis]